MTALEAAVRIVSDVTLAVLILGAIWLFRRCP